VWLEEGENDLSQKREKRITLGIEETSWKENRRVKTGASAKRTGKEKMGSKGTTEDNRKSIASRGTVARRNEKEEGKALREGSRFRKLGNEAEGRRERSVKRGGKPRLRGSWEPEHDITLKGRVK